MKLSMFLRHDLKFSLCFRSNVHNAAHLHKLNVSNAVKMKTLFIDDVVYESRNPPI